MSAYLFIHFKEKRTPDGEQVYFGISRDGFNWELINDGQPVLWSYYGGKGVRDHTIIIHTQDGKFVILATDLSYLMVCRINITICGVKSPEMAVNRLLCGNQMI